ncbi:hypothetical protein [Arhodomonas sp. AD133]|uniref:hypothetical protein n=1 Tax=Arhodomonas sp. AD133 TaxID=3415009 RepID=UPI003EBF28C0
MSRNGDGIGGIFAIGPVYIRVRRDWLTLRDCASGRTVEDAPVVALSKGQSPTVLAIGGDAQTQASRGGKPFELVNGFEHQRVLIDDFAAAEKALQHFMKTLLPRRWLKAAPVVVVHPLEELAGGLSELEKSVLKNSQPTDAA